MNFVKGKTKSHLAIMGSLVLFILLATGSLIFQLPQIFAQTAPQNCPTGFNIGVNTTAGTAISGPISGPANLLFGTNNSAIQPINKVVFIGNNVPFGRAQATSAYSWSMPWITSVMPSGSYTIFALVTFGDGTQCKTQNISVNTQNPTVTSMVATTQPMTWSGPMSFSFPVNATAKVAALNFDATPYAIFSWASTIGSISGVGNQAQYSSGQTIGSGQIKMSAQYGGVTVYAAIPITVASPTAPLPNPTTTTSSGTTTTQTQTTQSNGNTTTATQTQVAIQQLAADRSPTLQNNPTAQDCAVAAIGKDRFAAINSGGTRPTADEFKKLSICFASSNYIVPSNFAPVSPTQLDKLPVANKVEVVGLSNSTKKDDNGKKDVLKISGKAAPNSVVIVYVFSDPLVLTTTADAAGDWSYSLENPIESGKHEVYAVVDKGGGNYEKSNPFSFVIGTAQAASDNPTALSLKLAADPTPKQSNRTLLMYVVASSLLVVGALVLIFVWLRRRNRPQLVTAATPVATYMAGAPVNQPVSATPEIPASPEQVPNLVQPQVNQLPAEPQEEPHDSAS